MSESITTLKAGSSSKGLSQAKSEDHPMDEDEGNVVNGATDEESPDKTPPQDDRFKPSRPQVWIKLRPSADVDDLLLKIQDDGKGIRLLPDRPEPQDPRSSRTQPFRKDNSERGSRSFSCDGVLKNQSQEETYQMIAHDLVGKAMEGTSGIIVSIGPESSGKFYSLFGSISKFQYRGIIPRCLERIFQICESKVNEFRYLIRMAIVEIRHDKIRDLLTLGTFHAAQFEKETQGMIFQKIASAEHGVGLLIRALTCQKEIPREPFAKPHTVVFLDIYGESHKDSVPDADLRVIKSRITFAKTAAIPERDVLFPPPVKHEIDAFGCLPSVKLTSKQRESRRIPDLGCVHNTLHAKFSSECKQLSCSKTRTGPIAEAIRIRQDIGFLEQMCSRACEYQKLTEEYERLIRRGVEPPLPPRAQHYRLSKLTYCLKEIVSGNSEIRIILHVRPERKYKHATLEAMRFADKVKIIPQGSVTTEVQTKETEPTSIFSDEFTLIDFLNKMPAEVTDLYIQVNPGTFTNLRDHCAALIDSRIHGVDDNNVEENMREMFEQFKAIWVYLNETGSLPSTLPGGGDKKESLATTDDGTDSWSRKMSRMISEHRKSGASIADGAFSTAELMGSKSSRSETRLGGKKIKGAKSKYASARDRKKVKKGKTKVVDSFSQELQSPEHSSGEREGEQETEIIKYPDETQLEGEDQLEGLPPEIEENLKIPQSDIPTKDEAWKEFIASESGSEKFAFLAEKNESLKKMAALHNDAIRESGAIISQLNALQTDMNLIQQDRFLQGAQYDPNGEIVVGPHEKQIIHEIKNLENVRSNLALKMKAVRTQLFSLKNERDAMQMTLNTEFEGYTKRMYGVSYGEADQVQKALELDAAKPTTPPDRDNIKKYEDIRRVARKQARLFLRALVKKPLWVPY